MSRTLALLLVMWMPWASATVRAPLPHDVARLEQALAAQPHNIDIVETLATALLTEVRISARADQLARAEVLIERLLHQRSPRADALNAWRLLILHRFDAALAAARRAQASGSDALLATLSEADALLELGRYQDAERAVQTLLDHHYGSAALARASHLRRLSGDLPGAMEMAATAVRLSATPSDRAWLTLDWAELHLYAGQAQEALALASSAVTQLPVPALALQARAQQALGATRAALALYRKAAASGPRAELEVEILKLAQREGDRALVARTTRLLEGMARLAANDGGERRAFIEFHLLRDELAAATALARAEWQQRPDIYSAAHLAWVLFRADRRDEAAVYAARALAEHSIDPLLQWRAGTVLAAVGDARGALEVAAALKAQPWLAGETQRLASQP
jgi:tetratricopeptide (TPR) repeat protein